MVIDALYSFQYDVNENISNKEIFCYGTGKEIFFMTEFENETLTINLLPVVVFTLSCLNLKMKLTMNLLPVVVFTLTCIYVLYGKRCFHFLKWRLYESFSIKAKRPIHISFMIIKSLTLCSDRRDGRRKEGRGGGRMIGICQHMHLMKLLLIQEQPKQA